MQPINRAENSSADAERVRATLFRRASLTQIMRKTLEFCRNRRTFAETEGFMAGVAEMRYSDQAPATIIDMLVDAGALTKIYVDNAGNDIPAAKLASLSEDQVDDLVRSYALQSTAAAVRVIGAMRPEDLLNELFEKHPDRVAFYRGTLEACRKPQSFKDLEALLADVKNLPSSNEYSSLPLYPSAIVGALEKAGGLVWEDAWLTTDAGDAMLAPQTR